MAHVASAEGIFEVALTPSGRYRVVEIDQSKLEDHPPGVVYDSPGPITVAADTTPRATTTIDVMVIYTKAARIAAGGTAAMKAQIALAMQETNTSYEKSGIAPRLRLVHVQEFNYAEPGDISLDLNRLVATNDGHLDAVHGLRNQYGADMVSLIVENSGGQYCGIAAGLLPGAANAFQVTKREGCMTGYYSFGHEFGHLQGAHHDAYANTLPGYESPPLYAYGQGYVHLHATNAAKRWRTVMAYVDKCVDSGGYYCNRLQFWSNPNRKYLQDPTGNTTARNFKVLNDTAATVASWRAQKIAGNFNSNFNTHHNGWTVLTGAWAHASDQYYRTPGLANKRASIVRNGNYGDVTFEARMKRSGCTTCSNSLVVRGTPKASDTQNNFAPMYLFQYTNEAAGTEGMFSVFRIDAAGNATAIKNWTYTPAIVKGGWNTLKVVAVGNVLRFYINNQLVWQGTNNALKIGRLGISMWRNTVTGALLVDWAKGTNTATADISADRLAVIGRTVAGGTVNQSPGG